MKCGLPLQRTRFHWSRVQWRWAIVYTTPTDTWYCAWLSYACVRLLGHGKPFHEAPVLALLPEAVWNSVVSVATRGQTSFMRYSTRRSCSVSLCGLPLFSWAFVAPRHFHFTIPALTVDRGTNWLVGKVAFYDIATLKVTELFSKAILLPMFVYGDYMAVCSI